MKILILLGTTLWLLACIGVSGTAHAADIHVKIQGFEIPCPATPCTTVFPLAKDYTAFKIEDKSAEEKAQVRAIDDPPNAQDKLVLENAIITAKQNDVTREIEFWRDLSGSDNTPITPPTLRFWRKANGSLTRGTNAAENDWVKVTGYVQNDEVDVSELKFVPCQAAICGNFNMDKYEDWFTLSGPRELKGWLKFTLKFTNDKLNVNWVHVESTVADKDRNENKALQSVIEGVSEKDEREDHLKRCTQRRNGKSCPGAGAGKGDGK